MAPEIVKKQSYDHKVDVWSATVVVFGLLNGRLPYEGRDIDEMTELIWSNNLDLNSKEFGHLSKEARSFLC